MQEGHRFDPLFIGVDHDDKTPLQLLESFALAESLGAVEVFISPTGKGYHFQIVLDHPISVEENYRTRQELGDDQDRLDVELPFVNDFLYQFKFLDGNVHVRQKISNEVFIDKMRNEVLLEKLAGIKDIVATYKQVGRGDCDNCKSAMNLAKVLEDEYERKRKLQREEEETEDVLQEIEHGTGLLGGRSSELPDPVKEVLSPRLSK